MNANRTGIGMSPAHGKEMIKGADKYSPSRRKNGNAAAQTRRSYIEEHTPIGTMPPPASLKGLLKTAGKMIQGEKPTVLIDKLAERLAFERTGVRLYEALLGKCEASGSFKGGPTPKQLQTIHDEEAKHFALLEETIQQLGGDPTAMTPSADLVAVESMGLGQVLGDPRTTLAQCLHAILVAELADNCGWELLVELTEELGQDELAERFRKAHLDEQRHLELVQGWVAKHCSREATLAQTP